MPRKLQEFVEDPTSAEKELIRKLYWAISSTIQLDKDQKSRLWEWSCSFGVRFIARVAEAPPPASRSAPDLKTRTASPRDINSRNGYHGQAGGGGGTGLKKGAERPSQKRPGRRVEPSPPSSAFLATQARLKAAALKHHAAGTYGASRR